MQIIFIRSNVNNKVYGVVFGTSVDGAGATTDGGVVASGVATTGGVVSQGHQPSTIVVASQVEDDRAKVGRGLVNVVDASRMTRQAQECLLHDVLRGLPIIDEQTG